MSDHSFLPSGDEYSKPESMRIARVDVRGKSAKLWSEIRPKLIAKISKFLDTTIDHERETTIREEAKAFTSTLLDCLRNKLAREGAEVGKIEAEISEIYAKQLKSRAEAEKVSVETESLRRREATRELITMLALTKAMLVGDEGKEALLLGKQIDEFLRLVKELSLIS